MSAVTVRWMVHGQQQCFPRAFCSAFGNSRKRFYQPVLLRLSYRFAGYETRAFTYVGVQTYNIYEGRIEVPVYARLAHRFPVDGSSIGGNAGGGLAKVALESSQCYLLPGGGAVVFEQLPVMVTGDGDDLAGIPLVRNVELLLITLVRIIIIDNIAQVQ